MSDSVLSQHVEKWRQETGERIHDLHEFLSWFNTASDPQSSYMSGWWDFSYHILKPAVLPLLGEPFDKKALEIGYGAGRLIVPACHFFQHCVGVDVHPHQDHVSELIRARGLSNFTLHTTDGQSIPLADRSVDFVYSFIVLQHLPTIESLAVYLREIHRVLGPEGLAILYMGFLPGRFAKKHVDLSTHPVSTVREVTLRVTIPMGKSMLKQAGFRVGEVRRSAKRPWDRRFGGQFYAIVTTEDRL